MHLTSNDKTFFKNAGKTFSETGKLPEFTLDQIKKMRLDDSYNLILEGMLCAQIDARYEKLIKENHEMQPNGMAT